MFKSLSGGKKEKILILTLGLTLAFLSTFGRLIIFGYIFFIGAVTMLVFGILHIIFLIDLYRNCDIKKSSHKIIAWIGVLSYPLIFIFQFDLHELIGRVYVYEILTGRSKSNFEFYAYYIAIVSGLIYLINFTLWVLKIRRSTLKQN